ncbi:MAG: hypothetical protein IT384_18975 [Deltaproteobacteria bacterium]|nr:hypothetical protein [Deltaproteobacteria bacterium]
MVRPIQVRDAEHWKEEVRRLGRMAKAAAMDPTRDHEWKEAVQSFVEGLTLLIDPEPRSVEKTDRVRARVSMVVVDLEPERGPACAGGVVVDLPLAATAR